MTEYIDKLCLRYRKKGVLVDANLLLLLVVGNIDVSLIPRFKRTRTFVVEDHALLSRLLDFFSRIVTTPNILTEVSNLGSQLKDDRRPVFASSLQSTIDVLDEQYIQSHEVAETREFSRFGLTDAGILRLAKRVAVCQTGNRLCTAMAIAFRIGGIQHRAVAQVPRRINFDQDIVITVG